MVLNQQIFNFKLLLLISACLMIFSSSKTLSGQSLGAQTHPFAQVYDTVYGIQYYDNYNPILGGDSVRKYYDGHLCNGMIEDHYPDTKILHKGFYTDGKLTQYTNYYPNGEVERIFRPTSDRKSELKKYYQNKILKSDVEYFDGNSTLWRDYYDNGQVSYVEEYDKKHERILKRCSYYRDGKPRSVFVPFQTDGAKIIYSLREYYPNGQLQEESQALYSQDTFDFIKDGDVKDFDEKGNLIGEYEYVGGKLNQTIK